MKIKHFTLNFFLLLTITISAQNDGDLDLTFSGNGSNNIDISNVDVFQDVVVQDDQKIVAVGMSFNSSYVSTGYVARFLPDGNLDEDFGTDGFFTYNLNYEANLYSCVIGDDGKITIAGSTTDYNTYEILVIRLNEDGTPDEDFGTDGVVVSTISTVEGYHEDMGMDVALDANGNTLVSGSSYNENYVSSPIVVRYTPSGELDATFGNLGVATIPTVPSWSSFDCLLVQPDGKIVAAGYYGADLLFWKLLIARFNDDGTLDTDFGDNGVTVYSYSNVDDEIFDLALTSQGKIVAAGFTATQSYNFSAFLTQFTSDGEVDVNFGNGGFVVEDLDQYDVAEGVSILPDGKIVVTGTSGEGPPNSFDMAVWKYNANGTPDMDFGVNGLALHTIEDYYAMPHGVALQDDGKIVVAGQARTPMNNNQFMVVRLENTVGAFNAVINVVDSSTQLPIENASVSMDGNTISTDANGDAVFTFLSDGTYYYNVSFPCYSEMSGEITVEGEDASASVEITPLTTNNLFFYIGSPFAIVGATVILTDGADYNYTFVTWDTWGGEMVGDVPFGEYTYTISAPCYETVNGTIIVDCNGGDGIAIFEEPEEIEIDNSVSLAGNVITANASSASYQWIDCNNNNSPVDGETGQSYSPELSGNYAVEITVDSCSVTSECTEVIIDGITGIAGVQPLILFPNPASETTNVLLASFNNTVIIKIFSSTGALIFESNYPAKGMAELKLSGLSPGVYSVVITDGQQQKVLPLLKS